MAHDPQAAILDMVQAIERAQHLAEGMTEAAFLADERSQWAIYSQIIILGEAAGRLGREFHSKHQDVPWSAIVGMRHRLVHGYDSIDWHRVWGTLKADFPLLKEGLSILMQRFE